MEKKHEPSPQPGDLAYLAYRLKPVIAKCLAGADASTTHSTERVLLDVAHDLMLIAGIPDA